jgi:CoA:oxalate CoA-transferase
MSQEIIGREALLRYRMAVKDVFYGGGVVPGSRSFTLLGDTADRLMTSIYRNPGRCVGIRRFRLYVPVFAGDYMEFHARVIALEGGETIIEARSFKIAYLPEKPPFESSIDVYEDPPVSVVGIFRYIPLP